MVVVSELISVTLAVRTAKKTATPSEMPNSVNSVRRRCCRHCFQVMFASVESTVLFEQFLQYDFKFAFAIYIVPDFTITSAPFATHKDVHRNRLRGETLFESSINEDRKNQPAPRGEWPDLVCGVVN